MPAPGKLRVLCTIALLSLIWGTTWAAIRIGLRGVPPFTGVAIRFAVASAVLLLLAPLLGGRFEGSRREKILWVSNGLLSFSASYGLLYWAEQWVPSGLASVLFATFPLFVAILAHLALPNEALTAATVIGTLIGFAGIAVIFSEDFSKLGGPHVAAASMILLLAPLVSAFSNVAIKKWGSGLHPFSLTAVPMGIAGAVMGTIAVLTERGRDVVWDASSVGAIAYLALPGSALTFSLYYWLLQHLPATRVSLIAYTAPVVAVTVGSVFLDEPYTGRTLAGTALVLAGVALANLKPRWLRMKPAGAAAVLLWFTFGWAAESPPPVVLPSDELPESIRSLMPLDGFVRIAVSDDLARAAAAFAPGTDGKKSGVVVSISGAPLRRIEVDGHVRALRFGPGDGGLYVLVFRRRGKHDSGETLIQRFDPLAAGRPVEIRVPTSAAEMDLAPDGSALLVACRNEVRVVTIPDLKAPRLFRVRGDNRAVAAVPGGLRVVVGQADSLVLVDASDRQGPDGLPVRERIPMNAPVTGVVSAPDGSALLARLEDGRVYGVSLDPLRVQERGAATAVLWPGARDRLAEVVKSTNAGVVPTEVAPPAGNETHALPPASTPESLPPAAPIAPPTATSTAGSPRDSTSPSPQHQETVVTEEDPAVPIAEGAVPNSNAPATSPAIPVQPPQPNPPESIREPVPSPAPSHPVPATIAAPAGTASVHGRLAGPAAAQVLAVVFFGPDNVLREALRVVPAVDGSWTAGPLVAGVYRVILDAGGRNAVISDPPFLRIAVTAEGLMSAPGITVIRIVEP